MFDPCKDETLLSALMDGELPPEQAEAVERHLQACRKCRKRYQDLRRADNLVQRIEPVELSDGFERDFWRKVAELEDSGAGRPWLGRWLTGWRPVLVAGLAAGILAAVFLYTGNQRPLSPEDVFISENMDFLKNYEVINRLDMLEHWDAIQAMKGPS